MFGCLGIKPFHNDCETDMCTMGDCHFVERASRKQCNMNQATQTHLNRDDHELAASAPRPLSRSQKYDVNESGSIHRLPLAIDGCLELIKRTIAKCNRIDKFDKPT